MSRTCWERFTTNRETWCGSGIDTSIALCCRRRRYPLTFPFPKTSRGKSAPSAPWSQPLLPEAREDEDGLRMSARRFSLLCPVRACSRWKPYVAENGGSGERIFHPHQGQRQSDAVHRRAWSGAEARRAVRRGDQHSNGETIQRRALRYGSGL